MNTIRKFAAAAMVVSIPAFAVAESEDSLSIQMAATVEDVCTVTFNGAVGTLNGGGAGSTGFTVTAGQDTATLDLAFEILNTDDPLSDTIGDIEDITALISAQLFCNGDYQATIQAANGAFLNADLVTNATDFSNALGYTVTTLFDVTDGIDGDPLGLTLNAAGTPLQSVVDTGTQHNGQILFTISTGQLNVIANGGVGPGTDSGLNLIAGLYTEAMTMSFVQDGVIPPISFDTAAPAPQTAGGGA